MTYFLRSPAWTAALVATAIALILVPAAQRLAAWSGFVAIPRVAPTRRVAYLGGPALALAVLAASNVVGTLGKSTGLALVIASAFAVMGLLDDHRPISPALRLVVQLGAASLFAGRVGPLMLTGSHRVDLVFTVVWLVAVVNGVNFLDNCDALAASVAALAASGLAIAAGGNSGIAVSSAAIAGACFAFFAFNRRPAAIYLGDAGSMFLGFLLPALGLSFVHESAAPVRATWVVVALLGLPVVELGLTAIRRAAHGRGVWVSAPDNLLFALIDRGLSTGGAVACHLCAQALLTGVALAVTRSALPVPTAAAVVSLEVVVFALLTRGARVHAGRTGMSRGMKVAGAAVCASTTAFAIGAGYEVLRAHRWAARAERALVVAADRLRSGDAVGARSAFERAERDLSTARSSLGNPIVVMTRLVPGVAPNIRAASAMLDAASDLAHDGAHFAASVDTSRLRVRNGRVPVEEIRDVSPTLAALSSSTDRAWHRVLAVDDHMLLPQVSRALAQIRDRLASARTDTANAANAAAIVPTVFGVAGERHYLVVAQNLAEARATGGIPASFGVLTAHDGDLKLGGFRPVEDLDARAALADTTPLRLPADYEARYERFAPTRWWENTNMSPDFPTVAAVMAALYERQEHTHLDGVISLDPFALRALLRITGPVRVDGWSTPISATNVIDVLLREQYAAFTNTAERKQFLGRVTATVWKATRRADLGAPARLFELFGPVVAQRHLSVWLADRRQQRVVERVGIAGDVPPVTGDALLATVQNAEASKLDVYMARRLRYDVMVVPGAGSSMHVAGNASLTLVNNAPRDLPLFVSVPENGHSAEGEMYSFVSLYSPVALAGMKYDGRRASAESHEELGRNVYSTYLSLGRGRSTTVTFTLDGTVRSANGRYDLTLAPQPGATDEKIDVAVRVPAGYLIVDAQGCRVDSPRVCSRSGAMAEPESISLRVVPA